jgi:hypothetical protein
VKVWLELLLNSERENMTELLEYKGYKAEYTWDDDANAFYGEVINIRDVISFQSETKQDIEEAFRESVDEYLNFCKEREEEPEKPTTKRNIGIEILDGVRAIKDYKNGGSQLNHNSK